MNEVKKCSISGIAFTMSTDAYNALHQYLNSLQERYGKETDGEEIIADIEARIAELILSTHDNTRVVERPLIENIIAQLGSAEAISGESSTENERPKQNEPRIPRRLYRDRDNAKLGGVCAGIARYFDIDPVWIRLAIFVPLLATPLSGISTVWFSFSAICGNIFGMFVLTYLVLWFAIPAARSPRQKLEMSGEKITEQSIREAAASSTSSDADSKARPIVASTVTALGGCLLVLLKIVTALIIFGLSITAIALCACIVIILTTESSLCNFGALNEFFAMTNSEILISTLFILAVLIPVILLTYVLICLFISRKPNRTASIVMFILWIVTFCILCVSAIKSVHQVQTLNGLEFIENKLELIEDAAEARVEQLEEQIEAQAEEIEAAAEAIEDAFENSGTTIYTDPDSTKISVFDIKKSGGTFRQTTINIDK